MHSPPDGGAAHFYPTYSRNGRWIAYTSFSSNGVDRRIETVAADGPAQARSLREINATGVTSSRPHVSIDGRFLSFSSLRPGSAGAWDVCFVTFDSAGGAVGPVTPVPKLNDASIQLDAQRSR